MIGRYGSDNLILDFGVTKLLLVGGRDLSQHILGAPPRTDGFAAGKLKRNGMAFLAPHALTISDDEQWVRLRAFNTAVLDAGHPHELRRVFCTQVHRAFASPPATVEDIRGSMGRAMLAIVFGEGQAPERLALDVRVLIDLVQHPGQRLLLGRWERRRRERFYATLRQIWEGTTSSARPGLLAIARREAGSIPEEQLLEQIPHWMFTFTGSGTDLLVRALTLISSHPAVLDAALREIASAGPLDSPDAIDALRLLEACLMEGARLYPPVTRTFHRVASSRAAGSVCIPAGMEILHSFPLLGHGAAGQGTARFTPERWLAPASATAADFDPFLGGVRHCPGRELIIFVCKTALAILLDRHRVTVSAPLAGEALPPVFPERRLRFRQR